MYQIAVLCCVLAVAAGRPDGGYSAPPVGGGSGGFAGGQAGGFGGVQGGAFGGGKGGNFGGGFGGGHGDSFAPPQYNFKYKVDDEYSGILLGHEEQREGYETKGKYYVQLPDGRLQLVHYTADQSGYHPEVTYEGEARFDGPAGGYAGGAAGGRGGGFQGGAGGFQGNIQQGYQAPAQQGYN